jgi:hypothetical protein
MSLRGVKRRSNLFLCGEIATPACRNAYLWEAFRLRQALRRAGTLPLVARNDNVIKLMRLYS